MSMDAVNVQLNVYDGVTQHTLSESLPLSSQTSRTFSLSRAFQPTRTFLAPPKEAELYQWRDPAIGWGIVIADTVRQLPDALQQLVIDRKAPIFRYKADWEQKFTHLRNREQGVDVDITGSKRGTARGSLPYYLLIYGPPTDIPWRFQYILGANRCVGRIDLNGAALENYVNALLRDFAPPVTQASVKKASPNVTAVTQTAAGNSAADPNAAVLWSVDMGEGDITRLMRTHIAFKIHEQLAADSDIGGKAVFLDGFTSAASATSQVLIQTLAQLRPAVVVTTSHGQAGPVSNIDAMRQSLGLPVDQQYRPLDVTALLGSWAPSGAIWYCHACCSAGSDSPSVFAPLFNPGSDTARVMTGIASLGPTVAPLPTALLGCAYPLRAFVGHVEPTFDYTLRDPDTGQPLTSTIISSIYPKLYLREPPTPIGLAFRDWFDRTGSLYAAWDSQREAFNTGQPNMYRIMHTQLCARDVQSTVILGDPAAMLPLS